eukprot:8457662-Lingulodinium_polyedra.AAC.1
MIIDSLEDSDMSCPEDKDKIEFLSQFINMCPGSSLTQGRKLLAAYKQKGADDLAKVVAKGKKGNTATKSKASSSMDEATKEALA